MIFYIPKPDFISVSISNCKLRCKHCMGKYLEQMVKAYSPDELFKFCEGFNGKGILISGGFDEYGRLINMEKMLSAIKKLKKKLFIAIHPGFLNEKEAENVAEACDIAFIDLPSENAIKNVFGLKSSFEDYMKNMEILIDAGMRVSPHITLGLNYGEIEEGYVVDRLKEYKVEKVVLNLIVPTAKTEFEKIRLKREEVIEFIVDAKRKIKNIVIGCMRPRSYDIDFIKNGMSIANPSKEALKYAEDNSMKAEFRNYCCGIKEFK
ncbi:MAG TPA: radical SAM protein [Thermoplasmatales archaeon]|nr:radical SAM protein [Thermoplasmatales archaeon]